MKQTRQQQKAKEKKRERGGGRLTLSLWCPCLTRASYLTFPSLPTCRGTTAVDFSFWPFFMPIPSGYWAMWISGKAPPSAKSSSCRGRHPCRWPYAGMRFWAASTLKKNKNKKEEGEKPHTRTHGATAKGTSKSSCVRMCVCVCVNVCGHVRVAGS